MICALWLPLQADGKAENVEQRKAYMHWVVRDPRAAGWLKYEFEIASLLDVSGDVFKSHIHVTGKHHAQVYKCALTSDFHFDLGLFLMAETWQELRN